MQRIGRQRFKVQAASPVEEAATSIRQVNKSDEALQLNWYSSANRWRRKERHEGRKLAADRQRQENLLILPKLPDLTLLRPIDDMAIVLTHLPSYIGWVHTRLPLAPENSVAATTPLVPFSSSRVLDIVSTCQ
jgi:hypothetical protein